MYKLIQFGGDHGMRCKNRYKYDIIVISWSRGTNASHGWSLWFDFQTQKWFCLNLTLYHCYVIKVSSSNPGDE